MYLGKMSLYHSLDWTCHVSLMYFCSFQTQGIKPQLHHPCYPQNFQTHIKLGEDVFDSPCTKKYRPAQFNPAMNVTVVGTGDYQMCLNNVTQLFSFGNCSYSKCSFDGVFQPSVRGSFMVRQPFIDSNILHCSECYKYMLYLN